MIMQIFEDIDIIGSKFHFYHNNIYVGNMFHPYYTFW